MPRRSKVGDPILNDLAKVVTELTNSIDRTEAALGLARSIPMRALRIETTSQVRRQLLSLKEVRRKLTRIGVMRQSLDAAPAISAWESRVKADIERASQIIRISEESLPVHVNQSSAAVSKASTAISPRLSTPRLP
jgi:hypothetical protein